MTRRPDSQLVSNSYRFAALLPHEHGGFVRAALAGAEEVGVDADDDGGQGPNQQHEYLARGTVRDPLPEHSPEHPEEAASRDGRQNARRPVTPGLGLSLARRIPIPSRDPLQVDLQLRGLGFDLGLDLPQLEDRKSVV